MRKFYRGEVLLYQENVGDFLYFLESGILKVIQIQEDGSNTLLNILTPGETFPLQNLIALQNYSVTIVALTEAKVIRYSALEWYKSLQCEPEQYHRIAQTLQEKFWMMQQRIIILTSPPKTRLYLFRQWLQQYFPNQSLENVLTQEEIACFIGLTRETVNRMLRKGACNDITLFEKMDKENHT